MKKRKAIRLKTLKRKQQPQKKASIERKPQSFVEFLRSSPLFGSGIDLTRKPDPPDEDEPLFPDY